MSKRRIEKRRLKAKKKRGQQQRKPVLHRSTTNAAPSAPTIWRAMHLNVQTQETVMAAAIELQPSLLKRDATRIEQIENAVDIGAVLDLTPTASGLAEAMWYRRMQDFGPSAAGSIEDRLNGDWMRIHANHRTGIQERFIGALRWYGEEGVDALLTCWDSLDNYGRSLACVALGLLGARQRVDPIWDFYRKVQGTSRENHFVGALWGLIDLQDHGAIDALVDLLDKGQEFYELFGFISRAGDKQFIFPLIAPPRGCRSHLLT